MADFAWARVRPKQLYEPQFTDAVCDGNSSERAHIYPAKISLFPIGKEPHGVSKVRVRHGKP
jgi:hypothetical protein